MEVFNVQS